MPLGESILIPQWIVLGTVRSPPIVDQPLPPFVLCRNISEKLSLLALAHKLRLTRLQQVSVVFYIIITTPTPLLL